MDEARDEVYCHLTARRAVATAALRLGLERMSEESLDSLAGVLLSYLDRIGQTLAMGVEASGRSSAHCNVLDCLRAVEQCTAPSVQRVHMDEDQQDGDDGEAKNNTNSSLRDAASGSKNNAFRMDSTEVMSWKGLAAFCFGPKWDEPLAMEDNSSTNPNGSGAARASAEGGKVGPSAAAGADMDMDAAGRNKKQQQQQGWNAPFPDELPAFPVLLQQLTANPVHPTLLRTADSLHIHETFPPEGGEGADAEDEDSGDLPDEFFHTSGWGEGAKPGADLHAGAKRKRAAESLEANEDSSNKGDDASPPAKRTKTSLDDPGAESAENKDDSEDKKEEGDDEEAESENEEEEDERHPNYVPRHFPSFPRPTDLVGPMVADDTSEDKTGEEGNKKDKQANAFGEGAEADAEYEPTLKVRSALVKLGRPWGAMMPGEEEEDAAARKFHVPSGAGTGADGSAEGASQSQASSLKPQIVPLGRASGSRVSRILEGSMDTYAT